MEISLRSKEGFLAKSPSVEDHSGVDEPSGEASDDGRRDFLLIQIMNSADLDEEDFTRELNRATDWVQGVVRFLVDLDR